MADASKDAEKAHGNTPSSSAGSDPEKSTQNGSGQEKPAQNGNEKEKATQNGTEKDKKDESKKNDDEPAGGFDDTPIPKKPPGWTIKFTFHRATNLPMADINTLSSDPYVAAELKTDLPSRHKEDGNLTFRTQTIRRNCDPIWNNEWIVANVPSSGFKMKARLYDEDPADHDDRLGNAHINVDRIDSNFKGFKEQAFSIKKRMGSKRAYFVRAITTCVGATKHMGGELILSVELLGRTKDENGGRMYTVGPAWWVKHYSPMLGRITGMKEENDEEEDDAGETAQQGDAANDGSSRNQVQRQNTSASSAKRKNAQRYNFQANQMQLPGPVPAELYHRYVEFKPFVQGMFTHSGIRGFLLNKALHHQHARVYNYDRTTLWGHMPADDPHAFTRRFLELVHYDKGGKIFTYVLTLDAIFRFTETGKEFGIDMLSKHTMHSNVAIYIAFSGEFFIRRHRSARDRSGSSGSALQPLSTSKSHGLGPDPSKPAAGKEMQEAIATGDKEGQEGGEVKPDVPVAAETKEEETSLDPSCYELIIDNDSGTYRPSAHLLPLLRLFLQRSFPGLHVRVLDCSRDEEKMNKLKDEQRDIKKKAAGGNVVYSQRDRNGSISSQSSSSSFEAEDERGLGKQLMRDAQWRAGARVRKFRPKHKGAMDDEDEGGEVIGEGESVGQQQEQGSKDEVQHGPESPTEAERIAKERGHEYDPKNLDETLGQGQGIGREPQEDKNEKDNL